MKTTRRGFLGAVAVLGALPRLMLPSRRMPLTALSVERSKGFVPVAEIKDIMMSMDEIEMTSGWDDTRKYMPGLRQSVHVTFRAPDVTRKDDA